MDRMKSTTIDELVENLHVAALSGAEATLGKEAVTALAAHIGALEAEKTKWLQDFRIQQDEIIRLGDEVTTLSEQIKRAEEQEPVSEIWAVVEAARCIRHWHDSGEDGMVVSASHVRALWQALDDLDMLAAAPSPEKKENSHD